MHKSNSPTFMRWNGLSIRWKLRISFALIIAVFILLLTTLSHTIFKRIFYSREVENFNSRIELADVACSDLISYAQQFSTMLLLSDEVQDYFDIDETSSYANLIKKERAVEIRFDYAEGSKRNNQYTLLAAFSLTTDSSVFSGSESTDSKKIYKQFYEDYIRDTKSATWLTLPSSEDFDTCLCYASPYFDFKTGKQIGHLVIYYDLTSLQQLLHPVLGSSIAQYSVLAGGSILLSSEDLSSDFNRCIAEADGDIEAVEGSASSMGYWTEGHSISELPLTIISYEPDSVLLADANTMNRIILGVGLGLVLAAVILASFLSDSFTQPVIELTDAMKQFGSGEPVLIPSARNDEIGILQESFNSMTAQISALIRQVYDEQRKRRKFELNAIQAQINPHFLYNTLNSICSLIVLKDDIGAYRMITDLSSFYRTALSSGKVLVTLKDELKNVDSYLKIQSIRYNNSFRWTISADPEIETRPIVKLTLQPLVENALIHAFDSRNAGNEISILCRKAAGGGTIIIVQDNGSGIPEDKISHLFVQNIDKFGLYSIRERLRLYFNEASDIQVTSTPDKGTTFTILLPEAADREGTP